MDDYKDHHPAIQKGMEAVELIRFNFDIDALTSGDAEFSVRDSIEAYSLDQAIDEIRTRYYDQGNRIFRIRQIWNPSQPWNSTTVYLAKGQDY